MLAQSPPIESIHICRAEYSKLIGARWKVGGALHSIEFGIELVQTGPSLVLKFKEMASFEKSQNHKIPIDFNVFGVNRRIQFEKSVSRDPNMLILCYLMI